MENSNLNEKKGNQILLTIIFLLVLVSIGVTFYKIVFRKNYQIAGETSCNPKTENCFVRECDKEADSTCSPTYYKKISKNAAVVSACEATEEKIGCGGELRCIDGEIGCSYTYCNPAYLVEDEKCSE